MPYRVKKAFAGKANLRATINGKVVGLVEGFTFVKKATPTRPQHEVKVPAATQAELKTLFERGDPCIEQFENEKTAVVQGTPPKTQ